MQVDRARYLKLVTLISAGAGAATASACLRGDRGGSTVAAPMLASTKADAPLELRDAEPPPRDVRSTCDDLRCPLGAPYQEAFSILTAQCKALSRNLQPRVFEQFLGCLLGQNNTEATCGLQLLHDGEGGCLERWSEIEVSDPTTAAPCRRAVAHCRAASATPLTLEACQGMVSAATERRRAAMLSCVMEYCDEAAGLCYMALDR